MNLTVKIRDCAVPGRPPVRLVSVVVGEGDAMQEFAGTVVGTDDLEAQTKQRVSDVLDRVFSVVNA